MNTRGLMELVILNVGFQLGVTNQAVFSMMLIMALLTKFLTTPVVEMIHPRSQHGRLVLLIKDWLSCHEPTRSESAIQARSSTPSACLRDGSGFHPHSPPEGTSEAGSH